MIKMEKELIAIKDIKMADYNPRVMSDDESNLLENSINQFGLIDPIIINNKSNVIIGGHQRFKILKRKYDLEYKLNKLVIGDIAWIYDSNDIKKLSDVDEKALNIALNKISGDWDNKSLNELLEELEESNYNLELTGFDDIELNNEGYNLNKFDIDDEENQINENNKIENENEKELFKLLIETSNEKEQEKLYNLLVKEGYDCRLLIL